MEWMKTISKVRFYLAQSKMANLDKIWITNKHKVASCQ